MKEKGREQIRKYKSGNPMIKETIEQQLNNVQDSYDSLLKTANQIKARLENSLLKFQEYEDILSSIWTNLEELETSISIEIDEPKELGRAKILLESMRVRIENGVLFNLLFENSCTILNTTFIGFQLLHNKLQAEKVKLASAVQNCEAAIACVSRPGSPTGQPSSPVFDKEVSVRLRLEDNIDQVRECNEI